MASTGKAGWIKVPRAVLDSWMASDPLAMAIYMQIRLRARWEDDPVIEDGIEVGRDQVLICQRKLGALFGATEHAVRSRIRRMSVAGYVAAEPFTNGVLITVLDGDEAKAVAGRVAPPSQKRRRSVARASQPRENLPIIEENSKELKKEEAARAGDETPGPLDDEGWMNADELVLQIQS